MFVSICVTKWKAPVVDRLPRESTTEQIVARFLLRRTCRVILLI